MTTATITAPAWTADDRELDQGAFSEGLHFIYDAPIAGHWVTTRGIARAEVSDA